MGFWSMKGGLVMWVKWFHESNYLHRMLNRIAITYVDHQYKEFESVVEVFCQNLGTYLMDMQAFRRGIAAVDLPPPPLLMIIGTKMDTSSELKIMEMKI